MAHESVLTLFAVISVGGAVEVLPPPTLLLNASRSITVGWQPAAAAHVDYQVHLTVQRRGQAEYHITKQVATGTHSLHWGVMPEDAQCCFRVAAVADDPLVDGEEVRYSDETCYSSGACAAAPAEPAAPDGSCVTYALGGAFLGAALVLLFAAALLHPEWMHTLKALASGWARSMAGGPYSHLTTHEEGCGGSGAGTQGYELETHAAALGAGGARGADAPTGGYAPGPLRTLPPLPSSAPACLPPPPSASPRGGAPPLPPLEPYPMIDAAAFELQWSKHERSARVMSAALPPTPLPTPDEVEVGLTHAGLMCIAAGAIGEMHKSYFAAQLRGSGEWLMLELVVFWDARTVQAAFRSDAPGWLLPLADHFAVVLGQLLNTRLS